FQTSARGAAGSTLQSLATRMMIDNFGNVGIGTTNALSTLDVRGSVATAPIASFSGATTNAAAIVDQSGSGDIFTASKSGLTKFVVNNAGYVGIGTANPVAPLQITASPTSFSSVALAN